MFYRLFRANKGILNKLNLSQGKRMWQYRIHHIVKAKKRFDSNYKI